MPKPETSKAETKMETPKAKKAVKKQPFYFPTVRQGTTVMASSLEEAEKIVSQLQVIPPLSLGQ